MKGFEKMYMTFKFDYNKHRCNIDKFLYLIFRCH